MNLKQLIASVDRKTGYDWTPPDILEAINSGARRVYNWMLKENPSHQFVKWDLTKTLVPGTQEYQLPADLEQILRIREKDPASGEWRVIHMVSDANALSALEASTNQALLMGFGDFDENVSPFKYYGPYDKNDGKFYIQVQPGIDMNRSLEIMYSAVFIEIHSDADTLMIPDEGTDIVRDFAIAELKEDNDDDTAQLKDARAMAKLTVWLTIIRARQLGDTPLKQDAYLDE